ncbi:hypothetical protein, partial [Paenibacillus naphthalenovorans]|uniref:hypothetical protein n=1 Tax=Paenibacillus naphthalenovorans TaxID=162209 RepID=UPI003D274176
AAVCFNIDSEDGHLSSFSRQSTQDVSRMSYSEQKSSSSQMGSIDSPFNKARFAACLKQSHSPVVSD